MYTGHYVQKKNKFIFKTNILKFTGQVVTVKKKRRFMFTQPRRPVRTSNMSFLSRAPTICIDFADVQSLYALY